MNICEYTTVANVKTYKDQGTATASDGLLLSMIRQASREIEDITNRWFYPRIVTLTHDTPRRTNDINFDVDILEITTLTNGDGTVINSTNYKLYPLNKYPKEWLTLLNKQYVWLMDNYGNSNGAISLAVVSGYHDDYPSAWGLVTTLSAAITTTAATSATVPTGLISAGDLIKIDSEYLYVSAVTVSTTDTLTLVRGVNGSTAATHLISTAIYRWDCGSDVEMLARRAATAYTKLRSNPIGETVNIDGQTFSTPKDVGRWLGQELKNMGLIRTGVG